MKFFLLDPIVVTYKVMMGKEKEDTTPSKALEVPTTEIGEVIPVLFGTRILKTPRIAWYGDVKIIKRKVSTKGKK
jgi:hypothetical protein